MNINMIKTSLLLGGLSALMVTLGILFGGNEGCYITFIVALGINAFAFFFSDRFILRMYKAEQLDQDEHPSLYDLVDELRCLMNLPMPKLWRIRTEQPNAFATGRSPQHASIAITDGIITHLNHDELRGVLAHELAHIKHRDTLIATIAATLATTINHFARMLYYRSLIGMPGTRRQNNNTIIMFIGRLIIPIATLCIQLAISRSREFLADETGATYSNDPLALAAALEKLEAAPQATTQQAAQTSSTACLFTINPIRTTSLSRLFSSHPATDERIARLRALQEKLWNADHVSW